MCAGRSRTSVLGIAVPRRIVIGHEIIVEGGDSLGGRLLCNDYCIRTGTPMAGRDRPAGSLVRDRAPARDRGLASARLGTRHGTSGGPLCAGGQGPSEHPPPPLHSPP